MATIRLKGTDSTDLDRKQWDWRQNNPRAIITKVYPDEVLPLEMQSTYPRRTITAQDRVSRLIEYEG